jgi:hypothetical protein
VFDGSQKGLGFGKIINRHALDYIAFQIQDIDQRHGLLFRTQLWAVTAGPKSRNRKNLVIVENEISHIDSLGADYINEFPGFIEDLDPLVVMVGNSQSPIFEDEQSAGSGKFGWALAFAADDFLQFAIEIEYEETIVTGVCDVDQGTSVVHFDIGGHVQKIIFTEVGK